MGQLLQSNDLKGLNIFDLPELLEQILYFLEIDRSLYPALFVIREVRTVERCLELLLGN